MTQLYRQCRQWWHDLSIDEAAVKYTMAVMELQLPLPCRNYVQVRNPTSIQQMSSHIERTFRMQLSDRASRVNRVLQGKQNFILDAQINGEPTKALVDSGAQVTVIPAHLVPPSAYTKSTWQAAGLMSEGPLPIATVTISVGDTTSRMRVLVKEGLKEVLLGQDYPDLKPLLSKGMVEFTPLTGILGPVEKANSTQEMSMMEPTEETGTHCLAEEEEAEDVWSLKDDGKIMAVQTRAQRREEQQRQQKDDEASTASGAEPRAGL